jgi:Txe/YoeB family toxin of Txe-Axe toxin-antitoxin module
MTYWRRRDPSIAARIESLIEDIKRSPFKGLGKPEPLKHAHAALPRSTAWFTASKWA